MSLLVENLSGGYGRHQVLWDVSLEVKKGEAVGVLGPNSAGKTTLLRAISGTLPWSSGDIFVEGDSLATVPTHNRVYRGIVQVPEGRGLFESLTVSENLRLCSIPQEYQRSALPLEEIYDLFPILADRRQQRAGTLSGGEQQILAVARSLRLRPVVLLLDEPSVGLAPKIVERIMEAVTVALKQGVALVLVEQRVELALDLVSRVAILAGGSFVYRAPVEEVTRESISQAYLGLSGHETKGVTS